MSLKNLISYQTLVNTQINSSSLIGFFAQILSQAKTLSQLLPHPVETARDHNQKARQGLHLARFFPQMRHQWLKRAKNCKPMNLK